MNYIFLGLIALLFLKAGWTKLQGWLGEHKGEGFHPGSGDWFSFDWNTTTPGKALGTVIPVEWVNWFFWGAIVFVVFLFITWLIDRFTSKRLSKSNVPGKVINAILTALVGISIIAAAGYFFGNQPGGSSSKEVVFNLAQRDSVRHAVGINTPIKLIMPRAPSSPGGKVRIAGCAKIIGPPAAVTANLGDPTELKSSDQALAFDMRLSEKVRYFLAENPLAGGVTLEFTRRQIIWGEKECP